MKGKTLKQRLKPGKSADRLYRSAQELSTSSTTSDYHERVKIETLSRASKPAAAAMTKSSSTGHKVEAVAASSDDYGFLKRSKNKEPIRVTIAPRSPLRDEVEYFDDSLFDIGFYETAIKNRDSIPITLGSVTTSSTTNSVLGSISNNDMPVNPSCLAIENCYMNVPGQPTTAPATTDFYQEQNESHYATLSECLYRLNNYGAASTSQPNPAASSGINDGLSFYERKAAEQRARSCSRGPEDRRPRSRSSRRSGSQIGSRSQSRGRSASRDIMALYTKRPGSACRLRSDSASPERPKSAASTVCTSRPESRASSTRLSTRSERSKKSSSRSTTPNSRSKSRDRGSHEDLLSMTVLEMDVQKNFEIERTLIAANSLKPANIRMMVIAPHHPEKNDWRSRDEVSVKAGEIVTALYKQNEWLKIITDTNAQGFVPYAYTKPTKVANIASASSSKSTKRVQLSTPSRQHKEPPPYGSMSALSTKPVTGILKSSSASAQVKPKRRQTSARHSIKHSGLDTDSLSSESSAAYFDLRPKRDSHVNYLRVNNQAQALSPNECMVIDTDDTPSSRGNKYTSTPRGANGAISKRTSTKSIAAAAAAHEEMGTYNSDSGISDPNSNHGEDTLDILHSPASTATNYTNPEINDSGLHFHMSTPETHIRLSSSSLRAATHSLTDNKPSKTPSIRSINSTGSGSSLVSSSSRHKEGAGRYHSANTISDMPLGPLGARLGALDLNKSAKPQTAAINKNKKPVTQDMRERARCSSATPTSMRPEIPKDYGGPRATVLYDYKAENEDDVEVKASDVVTVLNSEDIEWIWVQRRDGKEGFIPRDYVIPLEISLQHNYRRRIGVSLL